MNLNVYALITGRHSQSGRANRSQAELVPLDAPRITHAHQYRHDLALDPSAHSGRFAGNQPHLLRFTLSSPPASVSTSTPSCSSLSFCLATP